VFRLLVLLLLRKISPWGLIKYLSIYLIRRLSHLLLAEIEELHRTIDVTKHTVHLRRNKPIAAYLEDELDHFSVDQTVDRLPVDVGDEVTGTQGSFLGGTAVLHMLPSNTKYSRSEQSEIYYRWTFDESPTINKRNKTEHFDTIKIKTQIGGKHELLSLYFLCNINNVCY